MRNDSQRPDAQVSVKHRIDVVARLSLVLFVVYAGYLFYLQVVKGNEYRDKAQTIARQTTILPAQRGEIYDRSYSLPFVINTDSFAVELVPAELPADRRNNVFRRLSDALGIPVSEIEKRIPPAYYHLYQPIELLSPVPYATIATLAEKLDEYPGVSWYAKPIRNYLETTSLSHVLGYVGDITRDELKLLYNQGYQSGDVIGKAGIEKQYDKLLRGKEGREYHTVDVRGKNIQSETGVIVPPVQGSNLVLTIDANIQHIAEKALGQRMGSVVVLKPATGEVLGLVSYPFFNPNIFTGIEAGNAYAKLLGDPNIPMMNRTIQSSYPPASTFKTVLSAGILEEGAFPPDKKILCQGEVSYGDRVFHCWIKKPGHGWLDLKGALEQSCDIYFWTVGRDYLGVERIVSYAKDFGYGKSTGIDLPGEIEGFLPTPQWKERKFHENWLGGDTMNLSIGQGNTLVTPLQVADMMALIVNDGVVYRPHVLKELRDPVSGAVSTIVEPEVLLRSSVSKATFATLRDNLRGVVADGTAKFPVNTKAVEIAGKTGTAEVGLHDHWHSWFASYAPAHAANPQDVIVVVVMVEATNDWEWWAPYASNIIYQAIFAHQSYDEAIDSLGLRFLVTKKQDKLE
jgi:penicillin-binding protein 2